MKKNHTLWGTWGAEQSPRRTQGDECFSSSNQRSNNKRKAMQVYTERGVGRGRSWAGEEGEEGTGSPEKGRDQNTKTNTTHTKERAAPQRPSPRGDESPPEGGISTDTGTNAGPPSRVVWERGPPVGEHPAPTSLGWPFGAMKARAVQNLSLVVRSQRIAPRGGQPRERGGGGRASKQQAREKPEGELCEEGGPHTHPPTHHYFSQVRYSFSRLLRSG